MNRARRAFYILTHLGPGWAAFRLWYAFRKKSGMLVRRAPLGAWAGDCRARTPTREPLLFAAGAVAGEDCVSEAEKILTGYFRLFSHHEKEAGVPVNWHRNPLTGQSAPSEPHWSRIGDFGSGDIKGIWELSRFPWAWSLTRAFARTGDERFARAFWALFENWLECNPPNRGANWMCGQEATFRLMAATFARHALAKSAATTPERVVRYQDFVEATARRIAVNLDYALSQSNNHGVSECVGLVTAAVILPEAPESAGWLSLGLRSLEEQVNSLVYSDGAFAQHSATYHRVLLHDLLWCVHVLRAARQEPPLWMLEKSKRALDFVDHLVTPETGRVPLYGANDGANILPLADADYLDFRPVVQAGYALLHGMRRFAPGPWDEAALWLAEPMALRVTRSERRETRFHATDGGCLIWRHGPTRLFFRCPEQYRHRPSQADLLHIDLEWRGQSITVDAGTYSYNSTGRWAGGMKDAAVHNTVTIDGREPLEKAGRFLYLPWPRGKAAFRDESGDRFFEASHDGWVKEMAGHVRQCRTSGAEGFSITDIVVKHGRGTARLHWLLEDLPYDFDAEGSRLVLNTSAGRFALNWKTTGGHASASLARADAQSARGWCAPYYWEARPALSLAVDISFSNEVRCVTEFGPV